MNNNNFKKLEDKCTIPIFPIVLVGLILLLEILCIVDYFFMSLGLNFNYSPKRIRNAAERRRLSYKYSVLFVYSTCICAYAQNDPKITIDLNQSTLDFFN